MLAPFAVAAPAKTGFGALMGKVLGSSAAKSLGAAVGSGVLGGVTGGLSSGIANRVGPATGGSFSPYASTGVDALGSQTRRQIAESANLMERSGMEFQARERELDRQAQMVRTESQNRSAERVAAIQSAGYLKAAAMRQGINEKNQTRRIAEQENAKLTTPTWLGPYRPPAGPSGHQPTIGRQIVETGRQIGINASQYLQGLYQDLLE